MFWTMGTVFFAKKRCSTRTASGSAHREVSCWCHKCYIWHYYSKEEYWCQGFRPMNELWGKNSGDTGALLSSPFMTKRDQLLPRRRTAERSAGRTSDFLRRITSLTGILSKKHIAVKVAFWRRLTGCQRYEGMGSLSARKEANRWTQSPRELPFCVCL